MFALKSRLKKIEEALQPKRGVRVFRMGRDDKALEEYLAEQGQKKLIVRLHPQGDPEVTGEKNA